MAVSPQAGNQVKVYHDAVSLSTYLNDYSLTASANTEDVTVYGDSDVRRLPTLKDLSASLSGIGIGSTDDADDTFNTALAASTDPVVTIGPAGDSTGDRADLFSGIQTNFEYSAPVAGVVSVSADYENAKEIGFGRFLRPLTTASSSTAANGAVVSGSSAGTTEGFVVHLHATTVKAGSTYSLAVQHTSASTAGWSDLQTIDLTTNSSEARQRITGTADVKQEVRFAIKEAAAGSEATFAVAFARLGDTVKD